MTGKYCDYGGDSIFVSVDDQAPSLGQPQVIDLEEPSGPMVGERAWALGARCRLSPSSDRAPSVWPQLQRRQQRSYTCRSLGTHEVRFRGRDARRGPSLTRRVSRLDTCGALVRASSSERVATRWQPPRFHSESCARSLEAKHVLGAEGQCIMYEDEAPLVLPRHEAIGVDCVLDPENIIVALRLSERKVSRFSSSTAITAAQRW